MIGLRVPTLSSTWNSGHPSSHILNGLSWKIAKPSIMRPRNRCTINFLSVFPSDLLRDGARADDPLAVYLQDIDIVSMLIRNASTPLTNTLPGSRQALKVTKGLSFVSCWMRNVNQEDEAETDFPLSKDAPRNTQAGFTLA